MTYYLLFLLILVKNLKYQTKQQICKYNYIQTLRSSPIHKFKLIKLPQKNQQFNQNHFQVSWVDISSKSFSFFGQNSIFAGHNLGSKYKFIWPRRLKQVLKEMECVQAQIQQINQFCQIKNNNQPKNQEFISNKNFKCKVPKNHVVILIQFPISLPNTKALPQHRISVFSALHQYENKYNFQKMLKQHIKQISDNIKMFRLNSFQINSAIQKKPAEIKQQLSQLLNNNKILSNQFKLNQPNDIQNAVFIKLLTQNNEFILGQIENGAREIARVCDNQKIKIQQNCNINVGKKNKKK